MIRAMRCLVTELPTRACAHRRAANRTDPVRECIVSVFEMSPDEIAVLAPGVPAPRVGHRAVVRPQRRCEPSGVDSTREGIEVLAQPSSARKSDALVEQHECPAACLERGRDAPVVPRSTTDLAHLESSGVVNVPSAGIKVDCVGHRRRRRRDLEGIDRRRDGREGPSGGWRREGEQWLWSRRKVRKGRERTLFKIGFNRRGRSRGTGWRARDPSRQRLDRPVGRSCLHRTGGECVSELINPSQLSGRRTRVSATPHWDSGAWYRHSGASDCICG